MAFVEGQKSMFSAGANLRRDEARLRTGRMERGVWRAVEVEWKGKWYKAKTIAADGERRKSALHHLR